METAVFGGGCFWCTEAIFTSIRGVSSVSPGYTGGVLENPTYEDVSSGKTGHAEAIRVVFDPVQISFDDLLTVFFATHDPTSLNRQGNDAGTQYRSAIFYTSPEQKSVAENRIRALQSEMNKQIVTEVKPFDVFYDAESYHRNYYAEHVEEPYCKLVIDPKLKKMREQFQLLLKNEK